MKVNFEKNNFFYVRLINFILFHFIEQKECLQDSANRPRLGHTGRWAEPAVAVSELWEGVPRALGNKLSVRCQERIKHCCEFSLGLPTDTSEGLEVIAKDKHPLWPAVVRDPVRRLGVTIVVLDVLWPIRPVVGVQSFCSKNTFQSLPT